MILGFKQQFVDKIVSGQKLHTIREDKKNRWSRYHIIHMSTGVRTKDYHCFLTRHCVSVQNITINPISKQVAIDNKWILCEDSITGINALSSVADVFGKWVLNNKVHLEVLAKNDGFDSVDEFWQWFDKPFEGKIIHWTTLKY